MSRHDKPVAIQRPTPEGKVWVRFKVDCIHCGLPFAAGDEIMVEHHWADSIEAIGSGHRITHQPTKE